MLAHVGGVVAALHRDRFGSLDDAGLPPGAMRPLTAAERRALVDMLPLDRVAVRELDARDARRSGAAVEATVSEQEEDREATARPEEEATACCSTGREVAACESDAHPEAAVAAEPIDVGSTLGKRTVRECDLSEENETGTAVAGPSPRLLSHASLVQSRKDL